MAARLMTFAIWIESMNVGTKFSIKYRLKAKTNREVVIERAKPKSLTLVLVLFC